MLRPRFVVENAEGQVIFTTTGPFWTAQWVCCPRDLEFPVSDFYYAFWVLLFYEHAVVKDRKRSYI